MKTERDTQQATRLILQQHSLFLSDILASHSSEHMSCTFVGRTHSIVRFRTRIRPNDGSEKIGGFVYVWGGFLQRNFVLWVFVCPNNITLFSTLFLPLPCVFSASLLRLPHQGRPSPIYIASAITPSPRHGYHACVFTSRLSRHSSEFHFRVITPELSRFTTHVNRVVTPALVSSS